MTVIVVVTSWTGDKNKSKEMPLKRKKSNENDDTTTNYAISKAAKAEVVEEEQGATTHEKIPLRNQSSYKELSGGYQEILRSIQVGVTPLVHLPFWECSC